LIKLSPYNIPDKNLFESRKNSILVWQPDAVYVILGQRDKIKDAVLEEAILKEKALVMQRPSGGHSVVLTPKTIVVSMVIYSDMLREIKQFFRDCNMKIITALQKQGVENLDIKGISDIVIKDRKIAGSSMYRAKDFLFFHAVLNISEKPEYISKFLKHPKTEPDYRQNRKHYEFITSVLEQGYKLDLEKLKIDIEKTN
jgi:lipoate-protein ligase A